MLHALKNMPQASAWNRHMYEWIYLVDYKTISDCIRVKYKVHPPYYDIKLN